ncbi:MAG TPA: hypothetical protein VFY91_06565 [Microbacterium sp.]|nr:hypothetical protein [Microbacterium sp.]
MSEDIDIRSGGVVAVDTETLRAVAHRLDALAAETEETARTLAWATRSAVDAGSTSYRLQNLAPRADAAARDCRELAGALRSAADVYEVVELTALESAAAAAGDEAGAARCAAAVDAIHERNPDAVRQGRLDILWRGLTWASAVTGQALGVTIQTGHPALAPLGLLAAPLLGGLAAAGAGTVGAGSRLSGPVPDVEVRALGSSALGSASTGSSAAGSAAAGSAVAGSSPAGPSVAASSAGASRMTAPTGLAGAAARIPGGGQSRVRVEKYTMRDGTKQFAVYVAGTQTMALGGADPFDNLSNVQAYSGERSASYEAVQQALRASGASEGDVVHAFGHSQGAMVAGLTAVEGRYDVQTLVSFGSPIEAEVPASTLAVSLRHVDDPVSALAGGGAHAGTGAPGSFTVEAMRDPALGLRDLEMPAHRLDGYIDTARLVDASDDPRVEAVREVFASLDAAASVEVAEYAAERR